MHFNSQQAAVDSESVFENYQSVNYGAGKKFKWVDVGLSGFIRVVAGKAGTV